MKSNKYRMRAGGPAAEAPDQTSKISLSASGVELGERIPFRERICCSIAEACRAGGFGRTTIYGLISSGRIKTVKVGRRTLISVQSLLALLEPAKATDEDRV
jgi:excisionase family DNA binding protein